MSRRDLRALNLNLLLALEALLQEVNVTRAARVAGVTQPAMSRSLAQLRDLMGDALLVRVGNEMRLTPRAERLWPALSRALGDLERLVIEGQAFDPQLASGELRVATGDYLAALLGPPLLGLLGREAPRLALRVEPLDVRHIARTLEEGADIAIGPKVPVEGGVASEALFEDRFACLVRADHPVVGARLSLRRYLALSHVVISPTGAGQSVADRRLLEGGHAPRRIVARVPSFLVAPLYVAETDLVLTAPACSLRSAARWLPVRVVRAPLDLEPLEMRMYFDRRRGDDPRLTWLRQAVVRAWTAATAAAQG